MTAALSAEGLHTYYGKSHILHGVSLEVAEGKITALLGRNGAGKSTARSRLMGLTQPRPSAVRRRTGDAVDRACAAAQSAAADSRRAVAGAGTADRARGVSHR